MSHIRGGALPPEAADHPACAEGSRPEAHPAGAKGLSERLEESVRVLDSIGTQFAPDSKRLQFLRDRLEQGRFHLAVLGQFKRGKSTLLNALLGEAILPTSVVPLTAIPTFLRSANTLRARVVFQDERPPEEFRGADADALAAFLSRFVTESGNPKNRLGVSEVEVFHPAAILRKGVVLIDTPGIGSTFRHNTEATLNFLPQCDAALFLVSADPPLTEVEVEFLKHVRSKVSRLFFILNKVDYLTTEEQEEALQFLRRILKEQGGVDETLPVFCVSARRGLSARRTNDESLWVHSGLRDVESHLVDFLANEKASALRGAAATKAGDILEDVLMQVRLAVRSLRMPVEDLQRRIGEFERKLSEIAQERQTADDLLTGDHRRMHEFLEEYSEQLRRKSLAYLEGVVQEALAEAQDDGEAEDGAREAVAAAIPGFFERHMGETTALFKRRIAEILRPHQQRADGLIESVRRTAAALFDIPYRAPEATGVFEVVQEPYWVTHKWTSSVGAIPPGLIDRIVSSRARKTRILKRLTEQIGSLVTGNVENLRWATFQSIDRAFVVFRSDLDRRLSETITATNGAIGAAMARRSEDAQAVSGELAKLHAAEAELERIKASLRDGGS